MTNTKGFIPVLVLVIAGVAVGFFIGAKIEQKAIEETMICHEPGKQPWCRNCQESGVK